MKGQSERVPRKNLRLLSGRPLFHWILDSLNKSPYINEIIINTDSEEIANSAKLNFDVTIHMRPDYLIDIDSNEPNQIMHYDIKKTSGDFFFQTHATNPLLTTKTINEAIKIFFKNKIKYDSLFSVTEMQTRLYSADYEPINHKINELIKTQDLPPVYEENSCIYIFSRKTFLKTKNRIGLKPFLLKIKPEESIDIDTEYDFRLAETIMNNIKEGNNFA